MVPNMNDGIDTGDVHYLIIATVFCSHPSISVGNWLSHKCMNNMGKYREWWAGDNCYIVICWLWCLRLLRLYIFMFISHFVKCSIAENVRSTWKKYNQLCTVNSTKPELALHWQPMESEFIFHGMQCRIVITNIEFTNTMWTY